MAAFDPYANQGGPAAWDPQHHDDSRALADKLLREVDNDEHADDVSDATHLTAPTPERAKATASEPAPDPDDGPDLGPEFGPEFTD